MGSVQSEIKCLRCKSEKCLCISYYKTGEETISCPDCGYYRQLTIKRDKNGNFIMKDKTKGLNEDNIYTEIAVCEDPIGFFMIVSTNDAGDGGTLETKNDYENFISYIDNLSKQDHYMKKVTVSRFVDGKIIKEIIFPRST